MLTKKPNLNQPTTQKSSNTDNGNFHHNPLSSGELPGTRNSNHRVKLTDSEPNVSFAYGDLSGGAKVTARVDWFTVTGKCDSLSHLNALKDFVISNGVKDEVVSVTDGKFGVGTNYYCHRLVTSLGLVILWSEPAEGYGERSPYRWKVDMKGSYLALIEQRDVFRMMQGLHVTFKAKGTRVDVASDYKGDSKLLKNIEEALIAGNFKGFDDFTPFTPNTRNSSGGMRRKSATFYIGSHKSHRFIRVYDKAAEQGERCFWVRIELVTRNKHADATFRELATYSLDNFDGDGLAPILKMVGIVNGAVDFINRGDDTNVTRCGRLQWWEDILDELPAIVVKPEKAVMRTLEEKEEWVNHSVAPTLGMLLQVKGKKGFLATMQGFAERGIERFTKVNEAIVNRAKAVGFGDRTEAMA